jgi:hypothetical protein
MFKLLQSKHLMKLASYFMFSECKFKTKNVIYEIIFYFFYHLDKINQFVLNLHFR